MAGVLFDADKDPVAQVARHHGVSEQAVYDEQQYLSGMNPAPLRTCACWSRRMYDSTGSFPTGP